MFDRRLIKYFDWKLFAMTFFLTVIGIIILYSAVNAGMETAQSTLYIKQMIWFGVGYGLMIISFLFNYKILDRYGYIIYVFSIGLLVCVLAFGKTVGGSQRWLDLGPFLIQPSEIVKISVIIVLAKYYSRHVDRRGMTLINLLFPILLTAIPFTLIVKQPDLGTAILIALIAASMTVFVKIEKKTSIFMLSSLAILAPLIWFLLKDYQKERIWTFLDPSGDPLGAGYHIIQSKIAIGSGMIMGKGFLKGTQNALSFLPEQHTDFIFSVLSEEWGLMGSITILFLFLIFLMLSLNIAHSCRDPFGIILAVGITSMIFWQIFINIGMVMGLMPVVGVPLPFISYGGSVTITIMISIGLLINVSMRRFMFEPG